VSRPPAETVHLGYAVGTGAPVAVPLAHTFVTGQTQLSGKTTTLRALVVRSGRRALAFVTKRGESFEGRRVPPFLPREGERPIHWRLVETVLASALGQRAMKYERFWLIQAAKGATSLAGVRENVVRLAAKAKGGRTEEAYTLIREYLDLVLPDMQALAAADTLDLRPGLNVMDLGGVGPQLQALVIRAALERVNQHETGVLTVFPEAWEFAPRGRAAPAKDEAVAMARKGAVLGNFLLCDSQDIAGVDTVVRQAASVWILGVQRELNELKRTIDSIPAGIAKPKAADVATLGLGEFYACWGRHAVKTYVQPAWMDADVAQAVAQGVMAPATARHHAPPPEPSPAPAPTPEPPAPPPPPDESEAPMSAAVEQKLDRLLEALAARPPGAPPSPPGPANGPPPAADEESLYQRFKARLLKDLPAIAAGGPLTVTPPEKLRKDFQREEAERIVKLARELPPLQKRVVLLLEGAADGDYVSQPTVAQRLGRSTGGGSFLDLTKAIKELVAAGLVEAKERQGVRRSLRGKIAADLAYYRPAEPEVEAVYQAVLYELATEEG
jgi:hypothetical protein